MKTTQSERIIQYIKDFGSISTMEAFTDLGITSIHRRLSDLREKGYSFESKRETGKNRYGEKTSWNRYWLKA